MPRRQVVLALIGVIVAAGVLGAAQPHGIWVVGPYYVAIVAALKLDRRTAWLMFAGAVVPFVARLSGQGPGRRRAGRSCPGSFRGSSRCACSAT